VKSAVENLSLLPELFKVTPMSPKLPFSSQQVPLENFIPSFQLIALTHLQHPIVAHYAPIVHVEMKDHHFDIISLQSLNKPPPQTQTFISISKFVQGQWTMSLSSLIPPIDPEAVRAAYMTLSFLAKSTQMVPCFGVLLLNTLHRKQFTYDGERVIGWAIQDGNLELQNSNISKVRFIDVKEEKYLSTVVDNIKRGLLTGNHSDEMMDVIQLSRNSYHVWLTFVTESGRIFDLDLSAWQFGPLAPFPCIVPVDTTKDLSTAFDGLCRRDKLLSSNLEELVKAIVDLTKSHVDAINDLDPRPSPLTVNVLMEMYDIIVNKATSPLIMEEVTPKFADPNHFWNTLKSL
jgi:hypothetical protein